MFLVIQTCISGVKDKIFPAGSDHYANKTGDDGCLIKDKVTKEQEIIDGFSNTLMIVECGSRPDTYKANVNGPELQQAILSVSWLGRFIGAI